LRELPTLDIGGFLADAKGRSGRHFVENFREACHDPGFCYLTGHGTPRDLDADLMTLAQKFFALPEHDRHKIAIVNSRHFRGYTILGDERTKGISDWRAQLDVGPEQAAVSTGAGDPAWLRLRGPNQWPESLPGMRSAVMSWMAAMEPLGLALLRALALGLGQPMDYFDASMLPRGDTHMKIIRYPPQPPTRNTGQGVGTHHDSGLLTLILQDEVGGLRVQTEQGLIDAPHKRGAYILNLGEMMQTATHGYLRATKHRVDSPPPGRERISIAYFVNPRLECAFEPINLPHELAARATGGQNADPSDPVFSTFGDNYLKIRLRAHPDVAQRHYRDVVG